MVVLLPGLKLHIRRDPDTFDDGWDWFACVGAAVRLDPDDTLCQMVFHEICHWITNGVETYYERDWGFEVGAELDHREHACQRLQATIRSPWTGMRWHRLESFVSNTINPQIPSGNPG